MRRVLIIFPFIYIILNGPSINAQNVDNNQEKLKKYKELLRSYADSVNIEFTARFLLADKKEYSDLVSFPYKGVEELEETGEGDSSLIGKLKNEDLVPNVKIAEEISQIKDYYVDSQIEGKNPKITLVHLKDSLINFCETKLSNTSRESDTIAFDTTFLVRANTLFSFYLDKIELPPIWLKYSIGIFILLGIILLILELFKRNLKKQSNISIEKRMRIIDSLERRVRTFEVELRKSQEVHSKNVKLESRLNELENKVEKLLIRFELQKDGIGKYIDEAKDKPPLRKPTVYYLSGPDPQGFFWDSKKATTKQSDSLYILEINALIPTKGMLSFETNKPEMVRAATASPENFLKPVCESVTGFKGTKITVLQKGQVELRNGKWFIIDGKKMVISIS